MRKLFIVLAAICLLVQPVLAEHAVLHAPRENARQYAAPLVDSHPFEQAEDRLIIDIIDIGTGDAILIRSGGETMLVDGGEAHNAETLEHFFAEQSVTKIDYFFNTHPRGSYPRPAAAADPGLSAWHFPVDVPNGLPFHGASGHHSPDC